MQYITRSAFVCRLSKQNDKLILVNGKNVVLKDLTVGFIYLVGVLNANGARSRKSDQINICR